MFQWDKSIDALDLPATSIIHLFRSMREVQLALPGESSQQASAFLCQYLTEGHVGTVVVFHLHKSDVLAFYFSEPRVVPESQTDSMLDQGLNFVESMGFLMTDQDIHLLDKPDQEMLWASLPLMSGVALVEEEALPVSPPTRKMAQAPAKTDSDKATPAMSTTTETSQGATKTAPPTAAVAAVAPKPEAEAEELTAEAEEVDDLLAAVEALRAKRPGLRARKTPPSVEDLARRREHLRAIVGRILASM